MQLKQTYFPTLRHIRQASEIIKDIALCTPLMQNHFFSNKYDANIFFKREDLQPVRSYKIRGAYNKIKSLSVNEKRGAVICASAGNHAQGVALACASLNIKGFIYMPMPTPKQKVEQVRMFGGAHIEIILTGDTFDDAYAAAKIEATETDKIFIHPFDDEKIIEGQATVGLEIIEQSTTHIDYLFLPVGGGGLSAGVSSVFKVLSPQTKIIGVEPKGAPAMKQSIEAGEIKVLGEISNFVDGAAVKCVGNLNFNICKQLLHQVVLVDEGALCQTILDLYNKEAIVVEPAGALAIAALDQFKDDIKHKNIVVIVSGSNNDFTRMAEIKERALLYQKLKHYFIIRFPQRAGALKEFVAEVLGPTDDIVHFEYTKKTSREAGPAVVGVEIENPNDLNPLIERMKSRHFFGEYLNDKPNLFEFLT